MNIKVKFNFVQGHSLTHYDRQSDIVDYRAAYFAAKNLYPSVVTNVTCVITHLWSHVTKYK